MKGEAKERLTIGGHADWFFLLHGNLFLQGGWEEVNRQSFTSPVPEGGSIPRNSR